ncbi:hypothetical protein F4678DRAFT_455610 [Xylaria arbuscula]|nr:hypothetical protein F4678DRAFT_455610 [Xylaria arbuscula]
MPPGTLKEQFLQDLRPFVFHVAIGIVGLFLLCTHDAIRWPWDLTAIIDNTVRHLFSAAKLFPTILLGLLVFGFSIILGLLPALVLIAIYEVAEVVL